MPFWWSEDRALGWEGPFVTREEAEAMGVGEIAEGDLVEPDDDQFAWDVIVETWEQGNGSLGSEVTEEAGRDLELRIAGAFKEWRMKWGFEATPHVEKLIVLT